MVSLQRKWMNHVPCPLSICSKCQKPRWSRYHVLESFSHTSQNLLKKLCSNVWQTIKVLGELNLFVCITKLLHHEARWEPFITTCESLQGALLHGIIIEYFNILAVMYISTSLFTSTAWLLPIGTDWKRQSFRKSRRVAKTTGRIVQRPWVTQENKQTGSTGKGL